VDNFKALSIITVLDSTVDLYSIVPLKWGICFKSVYSIYRLAEVGFVLKKEAVSNYSLILS